MNVLSWLTCQNTSRRAFWDLQYQGFMCCIIPNLARGSEFDTYALIRQGSVQSSRKLMIKSAVEKKNMWSHPHPIKEGITRWRTKISQNVKGWWRWNTATVRDAAADVLSDVQSVGPGEGREEEGKEKERKRRKRGMSGCVSNRSSPVSSKSQKWLTFISRDFISCCIRFVRTYL